MERDYLDKRIRKINNFPKPGIIFYDITTLFEDGQAFKKIIDFISNQYRNKKIDKVVGIDARGFLLASAIAYKLGAGISIVRKEGKLPYKANKVSYRKEYGFDTIEMHNDTIKKNERIVIADDLLATGGTMLATIDLVKKMGGCIVGIDFIIALSFLPGLEKLREKSYPVNYLIDYSSEEMK